MNQFNKRQFFLRLQRITLAAGILAFLLISIFLFISLAAPECGSASIPCAHNGSGLQIEESGNNERIANSSIQCPGSTGWTGASCVPSSPPTPTIEPDCMPWPQCLSWNFP